MKDSLAPVGNAGQNEKARRGADQSSANLYSLALSCFVSFL